MSLLAVPEKFIHQTSQFDDLMRKRQKRPLTTTNYQKMAADSVDK